MGQLGPTDMGFLTSNHRECRESYSTALLQVMQGGEVCETAPRSSLSGSQPQRAQICLANTFEEGKKEGGNLDQET